MTSFEAILGEPGRPPERCWSSIGTSGDRSCPRLAQFGHCRNCPVFAVGGQRILEREPPPEYIDEWTRRIAPPDAAAATATLSVLVFRIAAEWLALDVRWAVEVVSPRPIHRVPQRTSGLLTGLVNVRGELQLCMSLQALLGIEPGGARQDKREAATSAEPAERLIVAQRDRSRWVFPVDEVDGVHYVPLADLQELPATVSKGLRFYSQAIFSLQDRRVGLLSDSHVWEALERAAL